MTLTAPSSRARSLQDVATELGVSEIPSHVAIIMDANGRWANSRRLPRLAGHRAGVDNVRRITRICGEIGVKVLTLFAFSTENWRRPPAEVQGLMRLLAQAIDRETAELHRNGVQIRHIGTLDEIEPGLVRRVRNAIDLTSRNDGLVLNIAFNYGGRAEIARAVRRMLEDGCDPEQCTEEQIGKHLDTAGLPDPDLVIRTGGEMRLSNFLLWQAAYAEYYSTPAYWPDFGQEELFRAFAEYGRRVRRFGGLA